MDNFRYYLAVLFVVAYTPQLPLWFVIHPWARSWRKLGPARTYFIVAPMMVALGALLFLARRRLLGADLGTSWSLIAVAVVLFGIGGGMSAYEGITHLLHPNPLADPTWNYIVLGFAFVFEGLAWSIAYREFRKIKGELGYWRAVRVSKDPTTFTVLFEDSAAMLGLAVAFVGIWLGHALNVPQLDGIASIVIGIILAAVSVFLAYESKGLLIGESADPALRRQLIEALLAYDEVDEVFELLTMSIGTRRLLVAVRLDFATNVSSDHIEQVSTRIDEDLHARFPAVDQLFLDATARTDRRSREVRGT